jgi:ribosomal protein S27AE
MSNSNYEISDSINEEQLFCPNCNRNLIMIDDKNERWIQTCYFFNDDTFTCLLCDKIIHDPVIIKYLKSLFDFDSFLTKTRS